MPRIHYTTLKELLLSHGYLRLEKYALTHIIGIRMAVVEVIKRNNPNQSICLILSLIFSAFGFSFRKNGIIRKETRQKGIFSQNIHHYNMVRTWWIELDGVDAYL
jgi:hypothetical protein